LLLLLVIRPQGFDQQATAVT